MRLLLDTHIAIWALIDSPRLSSQANGMIAASDNDIFVSAASIWEIAIKHSAGRPDAPPFSSEDTIRFCQQAGYVVLPIHAMHAATTQELPLLHTDPFDRIIIAQAFTEPMRLLTHDRNVAAYGGGILLV